MTPVITKITGLFQLRIMRLLAMTVALLCTATLLSARYTWPKPAFYKYQVGATFGVNKISAALTDFPGSHWGLYARVDRHTFAIRREWDGEFLKLWGEPEYYERTGFYYGWSVVYRHVQWGPQIGIGRVIYNRQNSGHSSSQTNDEGVYGEISANVLFNLRGNGFGGKVFFNVNRFTPFVGATVYLQPGYAWNGKAIESERAD